MAAASISSDAAYTVDYSCRFDKSTPAYLSYTPGSAGDRRQITMSYWQKRCNIGGQQITFQSGSTYWQFGNSNEEFNLLSDGSGNIKSTAFYQDPNAWYNFVISFDTEQDVPSNRIRVWVNGIPITDWSSLTAPTKDTDLSITNTVAQVWGVYGTSTYPMDGYLSQVCMIDGLALGPTSFGEFSNNVWRPIDITGLTFGTTGYLLDFADSSALGNDVSGNDNDFSTSGLDSGDQTSDTPTNNHMNFASLARGGDADHIATVSNGGLTTTKSTDKHAGPVTGTAIGGSGKWYCEGKVTNVTGAKIGICTTTSDWLWDTIENTLGYYSTAWSLAISDGNKWNNNTSTSYGSAVSADDVVQMAIDLDNSKIWWGVNGTFIASGDPAAGSNEAFSNLTTTDDYFIAASIQNGGAIEWNFGQLSFAHTPPAGFKAINTNNIAEPTIKNSKKYFDTILYEGNGDAQKVGQFQPITETYTVGNSALFIKGDSTELLKTFGTAASDTKEGTLSMWLKIGQITGGAGGYVVTCGGAGGDFIKIESGLIKIQLNNESNGQWSSTDKIDDTTQWTNLVVTYDLDNGEATDRIQIYINGVNITDSGSFGATVSDSAMKMFQNGENCAIGGKGDGAADYLYDGYMAEVVWCDGQVLGPSSFGEVDSTTNRWIPKDVSGLTFGNNGFYLNFSEPSNMGFDAAGSAISSTTYRYFKMNVTDVASSSYVAVGEWELYAGLTKNPTAAMTSNSAPSPLVASSDSDTGTGANLAYFGFDNSISTHWQTANTVVTAYLKIDLGSGNEIALDKIGLGSPETADRTPNDFTIQGSNNDSDYTTLATYTNVSEPTPTARTFKYLPISNGGNNWISSANFSPSTAANTFYDTPTRNFAIMDPGRSINETMTKGNLLGTSGGATGQVRTPNAMGVSTGKWYFEYLMTNGTTNERTMYITQDDVAISATQIRSTTGHYSGYYSYDGNSRTPGVVSSTTGVGTAYGATYTSGDVISVALDLDIGAIWWGKNGTWQNSASEAEIEAGTLTNAAQINLASGRWYPTMQNNTTQASQMNFGQHLYYDSTALSKDTSADGYFRHAVPDGFKAIHVDHLTESDSFQSAFSWIKNRDAADNYMLFDRVRGPFSFWNSDDDANIVDYVDTLTRFLKQGAALGDDDRVNTANESYVYWDWFIEATGSGSSNEDGSINTAATLVDTTSGISISKFEGTGSNATVGHGLGVAPKFVILKHFDNSAYSTPVWHNKFSTPTTGLTYFDTTDAQSAAATAWNSTIPTSSVVSLGTGASTNNSGTDYMMYCFAEIEGFSKFGFYTGNGLTDGAVAVMGFKIAYVMIKKISGTGNWVINDSARSPFNEIDDQLLANTTAAETTGSEEIDFLSSGFKIRGPDSDTNSSGGGYVYIAFAQNPFGGSSTTPSTAF